MGPLGRREYCSCQYSSCLRFPELTVHPVYLENHVAATEKSASHSNVEADRTTKMHLSVDKANGDCRAGA